MRLTNNTNGNYTIRQLKLPLEIEKIIDISDPGYTFCEVMDHIDLSKYFVEISSNIFNLVVQESAFNLSDSKFKSY